MVKHIWHLLVDDGKSIWVKWMRIHYMRNKSFWEIRITGMCSWSWHQILALRERVWSSFWYNIGDGESTFLWTDYWHPNGRLIEVFPRGPLLTGLPRDSRVSRIIRDGVWSWPTSRALEMRDIMSHMPEIRSGRRDWISWVHEPHGQFSTRSAILMLSPLRAQVEWAEVPWFPKAIPKCSFILWLAIRERLALRDRPWIADRDGTDRCVLCSSERETHDHLFFKCSFSSQVLEVARREVKFRWPSRDWKSGIAWMSRKWHGKQIWAIVYRLLLSVLVYDIWMERNRRRFRDESRSADHVARVVIDTVRNKLYVSFLPDSLQAAAIRRTWRIAWMDYS